MRQVKSKRNKSTELKLLNYFKVEKIRGWRRNYPLFGKPDFVFPQLRCVIFADGCFWHGHDFRNTRPQQNKTYWSAKRERNINRDEEVTRILRTKGWQVIRIWECEINNGSFKEKVSHLKEPE